MAGSYFRVLGLGVVGALGWLLAATLAARSQPSAPVANSPTRPEEQHDPVPIRRVMVPVEGVTAELARTRKTALVRLAREEFDDKLRAARRAEAARQDPPRLVEARYTASLIPGALLGSVAWKARNPAPGPALLPLQPFNLAIRQAVIRHEAGDSRPALIGDLNGKSLGWWLERSGDQHVALDWTARGIPFPGGQRFDLRVPPAAVASLELTLPEDQRLKPVAQCLMTGPFPGARPGQLRWQIDCEGLSQIELVVVRSEPADAKPVLVSHLDTRLDLEPDLLRAEFDCSVELLHHGVRELVFECDPRLQPYEVTGRDLDSWTIRPSLEPGQPKLVIARLHTAQNEALIQTRIRAVAAVDVRARWTAPFLRLPHAVHRGENLALRVHPDLRLEDWKNGHFQFAPAAMGPTAGPAMRNKDAWQLITMTEHRTDAPARAERPSARLAMLGPDYRCRQLSWWKVGPQGSSLVADLTYEVLQGELHRPVVELPRGWVVDNVELTPTNLLRTWGVDEANGRSRLYVELQHPLGTPAQGQATSSPRVRMHLQPQRQEVVTRNGLTSSFPELSPVGASVREGVLAISLDPQLRGTPVTASSAQAAPERGPWESQAPDFTYAYRGLPLKGSLRVELRQQQVLAQCESVVVVAPDRSTLDMRLTLEPTASSAEALDLAMSAPTNGDWKWTVEQGTVQRIDVQRCHGADLAPPIIGLGGTLPIPVAVALAIQQPVEMWRLTFAQPFREPLRLRGAVSFAATEDRLQRPTGFGAERQGAGGQSTRTWRVPLPGILGGPSVDGVVSVHVAGADIRQADARGLVAQATATARAAPQPWNTYDYTSSLPRLTLQGKDAPPELDSSGRGPAAEGAELTTAVGADRLWCRFQCEVRDWTERVLPIRLAEGMRFSSIRIDERWLLGLQSAVLPDGGTLLQVPFPAGKGRRRIEVAYESHHSAWTIGTWVRARAPELPVSMDFIEHTWQLPPGAVPLFQGYRQRSVGASAPADEAVRRGRLAQGFGLPGTEWEALTASSGASALIVVKQGAVAAAGALITSIWLGLFWGAGGTTRRGGNVLLVLWLAYGSLGTLWLPRSLQPLAWYPAVAGFLASSWALGRIARGRSEAHTGLARDCALALLTLVVGASGQAQAPTPFTVYLITQPERPQEVRSVLAPPELLEQLDQLAKHGAAALQPAVLMSADYSGAVTGQRAEFTAHFRVHSFTEDSTTVMIPLGGVQLQRARCNGADIHPIAVRVPREGYTLEVRGRGSHDLVVQFAVPIQANGEDRELHCTIPELNQSRLKLQLSPAVGAPYTVAARGAQYVHRNPQDRDPLERSIELVADLGSLAPLQVRWRDEGTQCRPVITRVQEAYLWELRPSHCELHAVLEYKVLQGAATKLLLEIPEPLEVRRLNAARLPPAAGDEPPPRIRDWHITESGNSRRLAIELHRPTSIGVQLNLELIARRPLPLTSSVPILTPLDATTSNGFLAYRTEDVDVIVRQRTHVQEDAGDGFSQFWLGAGQDVTSRNAQAFRFSRVSGAPHLQLQFVDLRNNIECVLSDTWQLGMGHAELSATATLTSIHRDLQMVEWDLPRMLGGIVVAGTDVSGWWRDGTRLQVWLNKPSERAEIKITGWQPLQASANSAAAPETRVFELPAMRLQLPAKMQRLVNVRPVTERVAVDLQSARNLASLPDPRAGGSDFQFAALDPAVSARFLVRSNQARAMEASRGEVDSIPPRRPITRSPVPPAAKASVLLADQTATVRRGRWLHSVTYRLFSEAGAEFSVDIPPGAIVANVSVDGVEQPLFLQVERLQLPMPGPSGAHSIRLDWQYPPGREPLEEPNLAHPALDVAALGPTIVTALLPRGFRAPVAAAAVSRASMATADLERAAAQLEAIVLLAERVRVRGTGQLHLQLTREQAEFQRLCFQAERNAPHDEAISRRLQTLRERNRQIAQTHGFTESLRQAEKRYQREPMRRGTSDSDELDGEWPAEAVQDDEAWRGPALVWLIAGDGPNPRLQLSPLGTPSLRQTVAPTLVWCVALIGLAYVLLAPARVLWLRCLGPEVAIILAVLGWFSLRPSWWFVIVGLAGLAVRAVFLAQRWLHVHEMSSSHAAPAQ